MSHISVKNVTKRFNDKLVLDNISFDINEGDIFGLIGPKVYFYFLPLRAFLFYAYMYGGILKI